jgi:hypothetical protein
MLTQYIFLELVQGGGFSEKRVQSRSLKGSKWSLRVANGFQVVCWVQFRVVLMVRHEIRYISSIPNPPIVYTTLK